MISSVTHGEISYSPTSANRVPKRDRTDKKTWNNFLKKTWNKYVMIHG